MCNEFAQERAYKAYCELMQREALGIISPTHEPELPFGSIHPSDPAVIVSAAVAGSVLELIPWGWPPRGGKGLVINVRSEGRSDPPSARGIAPFNRFYEFADGKSPKPKFELAPIGNEPLAFPVIKRDGRFAAHHRTGAGHLRAGQTASTTAGDHPIVRLASLARRARLAERPHGPVATRHTAPPTNSLNWPQGRLLRGLRRWQAAVRSEGRSNL